MMPREMWSRCATVIGILSCLMIALAFLVPWYGVDYSKNGSFINRVEYSAGIERMGDLMSKVTIVLLLSLVASVIAVILSYLRRRVSGVIASGLSAGLLLTAGAIFYFGIIDALLLHSFAGYTLLNRTWSVEAAPMLGWWIAATVPAVQGAQAVVLAYSDQYGPRKRP
jgi:hypothetical protein